MHTEIAGICPAVSVIIPTYNAGKEFECLLGRLQDQTLRPKEIIVVDSSSSDGTAELARNLGATVLVIDQAEFDHGGTRNYAASNASGDILVFMTQDAVPMDNGLLKKLTEPLEDSEVACVYARQIAKPDAGLLEQLSRSYNYPPQPARKNREDIPLLGIKTFFCSNVCSAVRKMTFEQLGRFPSPVIFNEDMFYAAQSVLAGYSVVYASEAVVSHSHNYTLIQQFRRFFDNGVSMRMNQWILPYSSVTKAGGGLAKWQARTLIRQKAWLQIPYLLMQLLMKLLGFTLGKRYHRIPKFLCQRFTMHRKIWSKMQSNHGTTNREANI